MEPWETEIDQWLGNIDENELSKKLGISVEAAGFIIEAVDVYFYGEDEQGEQEEPEPDEGVAKNF